MESRFGGSQGNDDVGVGVKVHTLDYADEWYNTMLSLELTDTDIITGDS